MEFYWHAAKCAGVAYSVSIPNGMEFYLQIQTISRLQVKVSIPNGMEFYVMYKLDISLEQ